MASQQPADQNAILMMRFAAIAYNSPEDIPTDVTNRNLIPPANGSWKCAWGPHYDGLRIAINELAFVVYEEESNQYAVVIRGTTPDSLIDWHFDLDTWPLEPFPGAPSGVETATGTLDVFQRVVALGGTGNTLLNYFTGLKTAPSTVFVTGHSLGGTMAALVAAWLKAQFAGTSSLKSVVVQPYTFAAFTPGNQALADYLDSQFGTGTGLAAAWRYYNGLDVAPILWTSLDTVKDLYPYGFHGIGPDEVARSFGKIPATQGQVYFQPSQGGFLLDGQMQSESWWGVESQWDREAGYQHSHVASYLPLMLGQQQTPVASAAATQG